MKALAWLLWVLSALAGSAAVGALLAACWAHGDHAARWTGTGFIVLILAGILAALGACAHDQVR